MNNYFMEEMELKNQTINKNAQDEFDTFVNTLRGKGVHVIVIDDTNEYDTPDSIFPNNWISFHESGNVVIYPMFAENRRNERREDILDVLEENGFKIKDIVDYTSAVEQDVFLEGTGSILMDRVNQKVYCALSDRAHEELIIEFCEDFDCFPVIFTANQTVEGQRLPIYHTNVMMALGEDFAVICLDSIDDKKERKNVIEHLKKDGKELIRISEAQMHQFAGNMLEVLGSDDKRFLVMSSAAYNSLDSGQLAQIEKRCEIIHSPLDTIETCGGGSARCMMAEVFLPKA